MEKQKKRYRYLDKVFECRKELVEYLKSNGYPNISPNTILNIEKNTFKNRTFKKFKTVINNLSWEYKHEN